MPHTPQISGSLSAKSVLRPLHFTFFIIVFPRKC